MTTTTGTTTTEEPDPCLEDRHWSYFLASSLIVFFGGLIVILAARLVRHCWCCGGSERQAVPARTPQQLSWPTRLKWHCEALMSGQTVVGRILVSLSCILSIGSLIIYLVDASRSDTPPETCNPWVDTPSQIVDFAFNIFFMVLFVIRLIAANDKLMFWLEIPSFVDYFTIPPSFVGLALDRQWLGLRFLRVLRVMSFPDILQYLSLLRTANSIKLAHLVCILVSVWFAGAGFVHLVETTGDPFHDFSNGQDLTFWESVYFCVVTMSTVGYGDIYCVTTIGRIFMVMFIFGSLAMFASFVPEIAEILGQRQRYGGTYEKPAGVKHIILCGHITYESVQNFLKDFLHEDRENNNVKCLFLDNKDPDLELVALFKRHFTQVVFLKGTVMNTRDCERVQLHEADACLVLANPRSRDPDAEDAANIMRVIAIKNYIQDIRVVVQLIRFSNKAFCMNLPSWQCTDQVICLSEMKLGFMAQGCLAPGFSTLLANLFVMRSYKQSSKCLKWQDQYLRGAGMEVYTTFFSPSFHSKSFPEVAELCFQKLKILLVAIACRRGTSNHDHVVLNPGADFTIHGDVKGFFICQSEEEAKRALYFCERCHSSDPVNISKECKCNGTAGQIVKRTETGGFDDVAQVKYRPTDGRSEEDLTITMGGDSTSVHTDVIDSGHSSTETLPLHGADNTESLDYTGLFHWAKSREFHDCLMTAECNRGLADSLQRHVVLCIFSEQDDPLTGLCNFIMPLRSSTLGKSQLKPIVIVGNQTYIQREWHLLANFPAIYVQPGSPLSRPDLRQAKVNKCHMCVILTTTETNADDLTLVDKEAILCSLNIKSMSFQGPSSGYLSEAERARRLLKFRSASVASMQVQPDTYVPMLTELANDYNAQFLDQDDEDDPNIPLYMTQPFACGRAFAASVLDTLMSTTYFNSESLNLVRMLITGGATTDIEQLLAEGLGFVEGRHSATDQTRLRARSRVCLLQLDDALLQPCQRETYGTLFVSALRLCGILCLGLYRRMDRNNANNHNRYIITNPPENAQLCPSDQVYCLAPFDVDRLMDNRKSMKLEGPSPKDTKL